MSTNKFDVAALLEAASGQTGLNDFGPDDFRDGLEALVQGINTEVVVPPDRIAALRGNILRLLMNRLWFQKDLSDHPEILDEEIRAPIVISSLPRTGSTKLHRMLGTSGDFQALHFWKAHMFARRPGLPHGGIASRIAETRDFERWVYQASPNMLTGHPIFTDEPEEEMQLLNFSFRTISMSIYGSPTHNQWLASADPSPGYDYLKQQLQYLQWQFPEDRNKPWILKTPVHFGMEAQLLRIFDQPRIIVTHRDPAKIIPSVANITQNWTAVYAQPVANETIGSAMMGLCSAQVANHLRWRDSAPECSILDIGFDEISSDNLDVFRKVYAWLGMPWSDSTEEELQAWSDRNPRDKHGRNKYSAEALGTTEDAIRSHFSAYIERFTGLL